MKKILKSLFSFSLLLILSVSVVACGGGGENTSTETEADDRAVYTIGVVDYLGNVPEVDVLIEVKKDGATVGMKKADTNGQVAFELEKGDYTFVPTAAKGNFYYDADSCTLSAEKTEACVTLYSVAGEKQTIYPYFEREGDRIEYGAATVSEGATHVEIDRTDMAYYVFAPTRGGVYKISYISEKELTLGYFGDANVVLTESAARVEDRSFEIEVQNGSVGTDGGGTLRMVVGLGSAEAKDAILVIERVGDPAQTMGWTDVLATQLPQNYEKTDYLNHELVNVSIIDPAVKVVYNSADGYYHYGSENGPVVYVRISSAGPYLASFTEICETTRLYKLFYDEKGELIKKESYNELIAAYAAICDGNGVCPLTDEIIRMIKNNAEQMKWWDFSESGNNIFGPDMDGNESGVTESNLVKENAWMFVCCYVNQFVYGGDLAINVAVSSTAEYSAIVKAGEPLNFKAGTKATLTVKDAQGLTVNYNGQSYTANADGVIEVLMDAEKVTFTVSSATEKAFTFTFVEYIPE